MFICHKHARGHTFTTYSTPGIGEEFIGSHKNPTPTGKAVLMCSGVSPNVRFYGVIVLISLVKNKNKLMLLCCVN